MPAGWQGAAGVWVRHRAWWSPGVTQRLCLPRAFGMESMVKPLKTSAYSTNCCRNLLPCPEIHIPTVLKWCVISVGNADLIISPRILSCQQEPGLFCLMFAAMLVLFSCVNLEPAASACSHLENGIQLYFFSFLPSPYLRGGGGTEVQIFVFPGLTRFYTELRALSLFSCLIALSTLKHRRNFKVSHLRNKTLMSVAGESPLHTAEPWHWEGMWGAEVSEAVPTLPQPYSTKGSSMVIGDKYLCRACLVQGCVWYTSLFPKMRVSAWRVQVKSNTVL